MTLMRQLGSTMRVLQPVPKVLAFYDGRLEGVRAYSDEPNWLDDGAYSLGICSYAIVDGKEALVFDTHISIAHAGAIRQRRCKTLMRVSSQHKNNKMRSASFSPNR
jgi:cyclase